MKKNEVCSAEIYLNRKYAGYSLIEFAKYFGGHFHGIVLGLVNRFETLFQEDGSLACCVNRLFKRVNK